MLPDLPKLKAEIAQAFHSMFKNRLNAYLGFIGEVPRYIIKEGRTPVTIRPDATRDETKLQPASAVTDFKVEEIPNLTVEQRIARLDVAAREMADQISSHAFAAINEAVERVGNVIDAKGKPFNIDAFFEVLEKIQLDFEEDGVKHKELTAVFPPQMTQQAKKILDEIHNNPELQMRHKDIIDKKRMEWRAREASRKLVG